MSRIVVPIVLEEFECHFVRDVLFARSLFVDVANMVCVPFRMIHRIHTVRNIVCSMVGSLPFAVILGSVFPVVHMLCCLVVVVFLAQTLILPFLFLTLLLLSWFRLLALRYKSYLCLFRYLCAPRILYFYSVWILLIFPIHFLADCVVCFGIVLLSLIHI